MAVQCVSCGGWSNNGLICRKCENEGNEHRVRREKEAMASRAKAKLENDYTILAASHMMLVEAVRVALSKRSMLHYEDELRIRAALVKAEALIKKG